MTTSDERREAAAAEFRRAAREQYEFDGENFLDCVGTYLGDAYTDGAAWARLADLMDPTCEMEDIGDVPESVKKNLSTWSCSECGSPIYNDMTPTYCTYCGARVVSVDE